MINESKFNGLKKPLKDLKKTLRSSKNIPTDLGYHTRTQNTTNVHRRMPELGHENPSPPFWHTSSMLGMTRLTLLGVLPTGIGLDTPIDVGHAAQHHDVGRVP